LSNGSNGRRGHYPAYPGDPVSFPWRLLANRRVTPVLACSAMVYETRQKLVASVFSVRIAELFRPLILSVAWIVFTC
jgi:hypothetical protein